MTTPELGRSLRQGCADHLLAELYGSRSVPFQKKRYAGLISRIAARHPGADAALFRAPGRTELSGNHTDHQRGRVIAAAVDLDIACAAAKTGGRRVLLSSGAGAPLVVDLADPRPHRAERGSTAALVRGVAFSLGLLQRPLPSCGFHAELDTTLPQGVGLSSSAAVALLIAVIFNEFFLGGRRTAVELAQAGLQAENDYYGKPCGFMDQIASSRGGVLFIDFRRPGAPDIVPLSLDPEASGYGLFAVATGSGHAALTSAYAAIRGEMSAVAESLGKEVLREVNEKQFYRSLSAIRAAAGDRAVLRALHFFSENERVLQQADCLRRRDVEGFLNLVRASADSSWELLQNCLPPDGSRRQDAALAIALSRAFLEHRAGGRGAARIHGGGFAGTIQSWVPLETTCAYTRAMEEVFGRDSVIPLRLCPRGTMRVL